MAQIAITGLSGLVGGHVGRRLAAAGHVVTGISRRQVARLDGLEVRQADLADAVALADALEGCDMMLHFADRANRRTYAEEDVATAASIVAAIRTAAARIDLGRIVVASSVYAEHEGPDRYARSKRAMEAVALAPEPGERAVVLRLPPLHGAGAKGTVRHIAWAAASGWPLPFGLATASRRFLSLDALADLYARLADLDEGRFQAMTGRVWYPSSSRQSSLSNLARSLGNDRTRMIAVPGIDRLITGTLPSSQLANEQAALLEAAGWQADR